MRDPRLTFGELGNDILEDLCVVPVTECWHIDDGPSIGLGQRAPGMRHETDWPDKESDQSQVVHPSRPLLMHKIIDSCAW